MCWVLLQMYSESFPWELLELREDDKVHPNT